MHAISQCWKSAEKYAHCDSLPSFCSAWFCSLAAIGLDKTCTVVPAAENVLQSVSKENPTSPLGSYFEYRANVFDRTGFFASL